jgi:hypothetical protein
VVSALRFGDGVHPGAGAAAVSTLQSIRGVRGRDGREPVEIFGRAGGGPDFALLGIGVFGSEAGDGGKFEGVGEGAHVAYGGFGGGDFFVFLFVVEVFGSGGGGVVGSGLIIRMR